MALVKTLRIETEPAATRVTMTSSQFIVDLADGRGLSIPLEWYPRLKNGSKKERDNWRLLGDGYAIEWPDLDEHIGVEGFNRGKAERGE